MAIPLQIPYFVVPISIIRDKRPGGWEACVRDHMQLHVNPRNNDEAQAIYLRDLAPKATE